ncbi:hypothetical protein BGZ96_003662 [Linnemannia gamsii]|uniref:Peptidase A1 domain-containing protein n=1 Tax=Linnemannia gamsii TaxID=64522 RepID=A0ABQ7K7K4_9FUNG|nr:hypothetical protein BGZ96_003662 [Linnemannia gamsii]
MTPHRSFWILLCIFALLLLNTNPCIAATTDNTHIHHELRAITPDTTGLTISDPNVIDHDEKPIYHQPIEYEVPANLIIDVGVSYTTAAYNGKGGVFAAVENE